MKTYKLNMTLSTQMNIEESEILDRLVRFAEDNKFLLGGGLQIENKQTSVEWIYELSKEREPDKFDWEQAKEMEKEQIIDAFKRGTINEMNGIEEINSEQYYNETFKKD